MEGCGLAVGIKNIVVQGGHQRHFCQLSSWVQLGSACIGVRTAPERTVQVPQPTWSRGIPRRRQRRQHGFRLLSLAPRATMLAKGPSCMSNGTTAVIAAVESLPFGVATADADGNITWANAAYALLSDCTPGDLVGQSAGEFDWDALVHAPPSSKPHRARTVCQRKSGDVGSVEHSITTLRNPTGEETGFWLMKRDITGLKRQPGVICEAEASLSALIESTDDLIGSFNLEYKLLTFNKALQASIKSSIGVQATV